MCVSPSASTSGTLFSPDTTLGTAEIERRRKLAEGTGIKSNIFATTLRGMGADFLASLNTTPGATAGQQNTAPVIRFGVPQIAGNDLGFSSLVIPANG